MTAFAWPKDDRENLELQPLESSETLSSGWYTSPDVLNAEIQHIFEPTWQYIGHESQLPRVGDQLPLELLGKALLLLRHPDQSVRCFANVCRHRAGPLVTKASQSKTLRCQYHAWTYNLDGTLIGAPKFDLQDLRQRSGRFCKLPEFKVESYHGFLFVCLAAKPTMSIEAYLGEIQNAVAPIRLDKMRFAKRVIYTVNANWKVYVDNYMEGYHIQSVHPTLAKILDVKGYTTSVDGHMTLQKGPLSGADSPYGNSGTAFYYHLFPNLMFNILPGRVQVNSILPFGSGKCLTIFDFYYSEDDPRVLEEKLTSDLAFSDDVQQEDIEICEQVQKGLSSGTYSKGPICPSEEQGIWAFQSQLRRAYRKF